TWDGSISIPVAFNYNSYPWTFLMPDGELFIAGPESPTRKFDWQIPAVDANKTWTTKEGSRSTGGQNGTVVMLPLKSPYTEPHIVIIGGNENTGMGVVRLKTAEIINLGAATPEWNFIADMKHERGQSNAVLLPDGRIWVAGGIPGIFGIDNGGPCEIYDPENPGDDWKLGPTMNHPRNYHSSALLLADGSVLMGGDNGGASFPLERYYPGYCFSANRPEITNAPATTSYGATIDIECPQAAWIQTVRLMRPGAVTHSFNMTQRAVDCVINSTADGQVNITLPANPNVAPPGPYLVFLVTNNRIPSVGRWIRIS
ncbi:MAG: DUF1929 domain-containing protein, partial [Alphaproteobacteria bacterium]|nr:DUF1929 domain-containing protein [Alphaproteobacteria bacterium]